MDFDLAPFKSLIKERTGLSFASSRSAKLAEVIRTVMSAKSIRTPSDFYNFISANPREFLELVNLLTVNETYFFREPGHLKLVADRLAPEILERKKAGARLRLLSAGCSTGEEPYSLAMALMERMGRNITERFEILGVDIDSEAIYRAKKGIYGSQSFRNIEEKLKDKYFDKAGNGQYKLKDFLKQAVELKVFNLSTEPYPGDLANLDVIFYRNVSIYFEPDTQRKIFRNLSETLNDGGYLITSATETLSHNLNVLSLTELEGAFFYRKSAKPPSSERAARAVRLHNHPLEDWDIPEPVCGSISFEIPRDSSFDILQASSAKAEEERDDTDTFPCDEPRAEEPQAEACGNSFKDALSLAQEKQYARALTLIDELTAREPDLVGAYALKGNLLVNLDRLEEAQSACLKAVEVDPFCLEGYLLLGLIARKSEDYETSIKRFREALYVRPSCWPAHFYLAEIHHARQEFDKARREYSIILNLSERGELSDPGLSLFPLSVPVEQMTHLCRHKLALMG